jgi:hypothetical protein
VFLAGSFAAMYYMYRQMRVIETRLNELAVTRDTFHETLDDVADVTPPPPPPPPPPAPAPAPAPAKKTHQASSRRGAQTSSSATSPTTPSPAVESVVLAVE